MKREIVLYKDARGKECICEAEEYDAVWASHPGVQLIERGTGEFSGGERCAQDRNVGVTRGRVKKNAGFFEVRRFLEDLMWIDNGIIQAALPNNAGLMSASLIHDRVIKLHFRVDDMAPRHSFIKRFYVTRGKFDAVEGLVLDFTTPVFFDTSAGLRYHVFPIVEMPVPV